MPLDSSKPCKFECQLLSLAIFANSQYRPVCETQRFQRMATANQKAVFQRESNRRCATLLRSVRVDCRVIRNLQVTMNFEGAHECSVCMSEIIKLTTNAVGPLDPVKKIIA